MYASRLEFSPTAEIEAPRFTGVRKNADGTITIEWTGGGTLELAPAVTGPWTPVPAAAGAFTVTDTSQTQFCRIRQ